MLALGAILWACLHNCLLIAVQALEGGICVELGITYTGRGRPKAEYTLWAPLCNCRMCSGPTLPTESTLSFTESIISHFNLTSRCFTQWQCFLSKSQCQRVVMWRRAPWPEWKSLANLLFEELHKATVVPLLWAAHPWVHTVLWNTTITITIDTSTNSNIISLLHQHKLYHCSYALHSVLRTISTSAVLQMCIVHNLKQQDLTLLSWALCCDQRARTVSVSNERQKGGCCLPAAVSNCVFVWDGAAGGGVMNSYHT